MWLEQGARCGVREEGSEGHMIQALSHGWTFRGFFSVCNGTPQNF